MKQNSEPEKFGIYLVGVGGQGIGLLSETLIRAYDHAGCEVHGADTHGLAQRGGIVRSFVRVGPETYSPLIEPGEADIVLALERTEALRGARDMLRDGGTLVYYDTYWQPLPVRMGEAGDVDNETLAGYTAGRGIRSERVFVEGLPDVRMQNMALLSRALAAGLLPFLAREHVESALEDLLPPALYTANAALFDV